jgi:hypothetical protein
MERVPGRLRPLAGIRTLDSVERAAARGFEPRAIDYSLRLEGKPRLRTFQTESKRDARPTPSRGWGWQVRLAAGGG